MQHIGDDQSGIYYDPDRNVICVNLDKEPFKSSFQTSPDLFNMYVRYNLGQFILENASINNALDMSIADVLAYYHSLFSENWK